MGRTASATVPTRLYCPARPQPGSAARSAGARSVSASARPPTRAVPASAARVPALRLTTTPPVAPGKMAAAARRRRSAAVFARTLAPLSAWIVLFSCGVALIPPALRPTVSTELLPRLDALIGYSYTWFTPAESTPLDLVAAVPYTVHTILPFVYLLVTYRFTPAPRFHTYLYTFGVMNVLAVSTHLLWPTAPPWYFAKFGTAAASYSMKGDPAVLARVDARLGIHFFTRMYEDGGKVVFGTWPSLHAAWPYLMAIFRPRPQPRPVRVLTWVYVAWVWWAAMYLQHHYFADVLGGALYAEVAVAVCSAKGGEPEGEAVFEGREPHLLPVTAE
jgi:membrane-associated phospholipid phosphatase